MLTVTNLKIKKKVCANCVKISLCYTKKVTKMLGEKGIDQLHILHHLENLASNRLNVIKFIS